MESAIIFGTSEVVYAEELKNMQNIESIDFRCRGCSVKLIPSSYKEHNLVAPHFKILKKEAHIDCDLEGEIEFRTSLKIQKESITNGYPNSYPNKLIVRNTSIKIDNSETNNETKLNKFTSKPNGASSDDKENKRHNSTAQIIRKLCLTYLVFSEPNVLSNMNLDASSVGIKGNTYSKVFKLIPNNMTAKHPSKHIFFSEITWKKPLVDGDIITLILDRGAWRVEEDGKLIEKKTVEKYKLEIHTASWSESKRKYILQEIEIYRRLTRLSEGSKKSYVFFIGEQKDEDIMCFTVDDYKYITFLGDDDRVL